MIPFVVPILVAVGSAIIAWGSVAVNNWTKQPETTINNPSDDVYTNSGGSNGLSISSPIVIAGLAILAFIIWRK